MKVPLIGLTSPYTRNLETGDDQVVMWQNGEKVVDISPYEPHCYVPDENGDVYSLIGQQGSINMKRVPYRAGEELRKGIVLDGARENIMDRLVIEHPARRVVSLRGKLPRGGNRYCHLNRRA